MTTLAAQFHAVVEACDDILTAPDAHESWLAAPFLHVLSSHPVVFNRYRNVLAADGRRSVLHHVVDAARRARRLAKAFSAEALPELGKREVLLVGGLVHPDHLDRSEDFYFGRTQSELAARGVRSLLVLRNQTGRSTRMLRDRVWRNGLSARVLLPDFVGPRTEFDCQRSARIGRRAMRNRRLVSASTVDAIIRRAAATDTGSASTVANLALEQQMAEICRVTGANLVMTMYEGHAWERCVWRGARRANPDVICAGYQHTVLREYSHATKRQLGGGADPSVLFCLGDVTKADLEGSPKLAGIEFQVLGTHRRESPEREPAGPVRREACLVLPEGLDEEAARLFLFAANTARLAPTVPFILRSHPVLPFERVVARVPELAVLPPNVEISGQRSIGEDLGRCGRVLYRGSNAAIYGILEGLKPYYLDLPGELTLDPLYALATWRENVKSVEALVAAFGRDKMCDDEARAKDWQVARAFCQAYARPEQPAAFDRLAELARSAG